MNILLRSYGVLNILLAVFFASQIVWNRIKETADTGSFVFWTVLAVGCLVAGIGYFLRARWIIVLGSFPAILMPLVIALSALVGGWIWGPRESGTMNLLIVGGFGLALIQSFGTVLGFFVARRGLQDRSRVDEPSL